MSTLADKIEKIDQKVKILARKFDILRKENEILMQESIHLKQNKGKQVTGSDTKRDEFPASVRATSASDSEKLRQELDKYISDIDHCIKELSNL